ncbi:MAG: bifunctional adenosylcobinamide kinase/adenosylcobinamide-phosphate guanylyltransferase [Thiohalomonadaceae bacterium]
MKHLILGGARSGKSRYAEKLARESGKSVVYVATAGIGDDEMCARIKHHRERRPSTWRVVEEPLSLAQVLAQESATDRCLLVDCLTLWLANLLTQTERRKKDEITALLDLLPGLAGDVLLVSNEVGWGIVPDNPLARRFRDEAGRLHQHVAELADRVSLIVAGQALLLKDRM